MTMKVRYTTIDGEVIAEERNGVRSLYSPDALGSTVALLDNTQTKTDTFKYWPYGETRAHTGTNPTGLQFVGTAGYFTDSSSRGYVRARPIDSQKGRWLTQDPIRFRGGDLNLFRYVVNRPISASDPTGLWCWHTVFGCIGNTCNTRPDCPRRIPRPLPGPPAPPPYSPPITPPGIPSLPYCVPRGTPVPIATCLTFCPHPYVQGLYSW